MIAASLFRRVLLAAGIPLMSTDHTGATIQLFAGHVARVAGAAWLASKGVSRSTDTWITDLHAT